MARAVSEVRLPAPTAAGKKVRNLLYLNHARAYVYSLPGVAGMALAVIVGASMTWEGVARGRRYGDLDAITERRLVVEEVVNLNGRRFLPDYRARGHIAGTADRVDLELSKSAYDALEAGDSLLVFRAGPAGASVYLTASALRSSRPMLSVGSFHFTWHLPAGLFMIAGMAYAVYAVRPQPSEEE